MESTICALSNPFAIGTIPSMKLVEVYHDGLNSLA